MFEQLFIAIFQSIDVLQESLDKKISEIKRAFENVDEAIELITAQYPSEAESLKEIVGEFKITLAELEEEMKQLVESIKSYIENNAGKSLEDILKEFKDSFAVFDGISKEMYSKMHEVHMFYSLIFFTVT